MCFFPFYSLCFFDSRRKPRDLALRIKCYHSLLFVLSFLVFSCAFLLTAFAHVSCSLLGSFRLLAAAKAKKKKKKKGRVTE